MPKGIVKKRKLRLKRGMVKPFKKITRNLFSPAQHYYFQRTLNVGSDAGSTVGGVVTIPAPNTVYTATFLAASQGIAQYGNWSYYFSIAGLPNVTEFTNLFDAYQIDHVKVTITPYTTGVEAYPSADVGMIMHYAIDHDGVAPPAASEAGIQVLEQYASYRKVHLNTYKNGLVINLRPKSAEQIYLTAITTAYAETPKNTWIDCTNAGVPHYGLIAVFEGVTGNANASYVYWRMETTYFLKFKVSR